jgi:hypothetical protein
MIYHHTILLSLRSGLGVVGLQQLLELEDVSALTISQLQQLAQGRIRGDGVLVAQIVSIDILIQGSSHILARHLVVLGAAQEARQLVTDRHGDFKVAGLALTILIHAGLALALLGLLHIGRRTLLHTLQSSQSRRGGITHASQLVAQSLHLISQAGIGRSRAGGIGSRSGHSHGYRGGRSRSGSHSLGLGSLGGRSRGGGYRGRSGNFRSSGLFGHLFSSGVHRTGSRGIRTRHFPQVSVPSDGHPGGVQFFGRAFNLDPINASYQLFFLKPYSNTSQNKLLIEKPRLFSKDL